MRRAVVLAAVGVAIAAGASLLLRATPKPSTAPAAAVEVTEPALDRSVAPSSMARLAAPSDPIAPAPVRAQGEPSQPADHERPDASDETLLAVRDAIHEQTAASNAVLVDALDSDDSVAKLEAIEELARRKHVPALKRILAIDPADDPYVGPTALLGMGSLARDAEPASREVAVARLEKLLAAEKERQGSDSAGNILVIFEALGKVQSASAARVLERELVDPAHGTAVKVAIVEALEACGQPSSVGALGAFRENLRLGADDPFERALEADLVAALDRALASLARRN